MTRFRSRHNLCLLLAWLTCLFHQPPATAQTVWSLSNEYPATTLPALADQYFAQQIAQETGGSLTIDAHVDGALGLKSLDALDAVASRRIDMASMFVSALAAKEPIFALPGLPFLTTSLAQAQRLSTLARPAFEAAFARHNQKLLYITPWPAAGIWARQPVVDLTTFTRLSIRTYDHASAMVLRRLGAAAQAAPFNEAIAKLKSGAFNAVLSSGDGGAGQRLFDYLTHFTAINYAFPISATTVNLQAWAALTPDQQALIVKIAEETTARHWQLIDGRLALNDQTMRDNNVTIVSQVPDDVRTALHAAGKAVIDDWRGTAGVDAVAILAAFGN